MCSPARASLVTGRNTPYHKIYNVIQYKRTPEHVKKIKDVTSGHFYTGDAPTIGTLMKQAGYQCGYAGKWHMGDEGDGLPQAHGFTEMNAGGRGWGDPKGGYFSPYENSQLPDGKDDEYLSDRLTAECTSFIERYRNDPFFLIYAPYLVHRPVQPKPDYVGLFKDRMPDENHGDPDYAAMVYALDVAFGKLLQSLKDNGVYENTLIVFTSDNGTNPLVGKSLPWRGSKGTIYEGGIRVPTFVQWPGVVKPGTCATPISVLDWLPTFLDAGQGGVKGLELDGESLVPLLAKTGDLQRDALYWHLASYHGRADERGTDVWTPPCSFIRSGDYKFIQKYDSGMIELYDLKNDPFEQNNLSASNPEVTARLKQKLDAWLKQSNAMVSFDPNPAYDPDKKVPQKKRRKRKPKTGKSGLEKNTL
jgi:arylsulfatase A-like enzyme